MKNETDRFNEAVEYLVNKGVVKSKAELARTFEISPQKLSDILKKRIRPSFTLFNMLNEKFNFNPYWLLSGVGPMFKTETNTTEVQEPVAVYSLRTDKKEPIQDIPLYDIQATAGLVSLLDNGKNIPIDTIRIPNLPKADGAIYVTGDSMYPLLKSGDIIIYKQIKDIPNEIFWGEMYIISLQVAGEEYVTVKYVQKSELGDMFIKLVSQNQHHQPKDYPLKKVNAMALVKASIRFNTMK